jgi:hypothetical protein
MRLAAISVDLDEIPNSASIHGLSGMPAHASTLVYDRAVERLTAFADAARLPLTLFAIGDDLARPEAASALRAAAARGHELANHTLSHRYDLTRLPQEQIREQVQGGIDALQKATGHTPAGFRAPGYTINDAVFTALREADVLYDSSVFPCPAYYSAKAFAIAGIALRGRSSRSIVDDPRILLAPTRPYRVGASYRKRGQGIVEVPIQVTPGARLPVIGTSLMLAGPDRARWLVRACAGEPLINLELHGIDVLEEADGLAELAPHQPDVRVPLARKLDTLMAVVNTLRAQGYAFVSLEEAVRDWSKRGAS